MVMSIAFFPHSNLTHERVPDPLVNMVPSNIAVAVDGRSVAVVTNKVPYLLQLQASVSATVADALSVCLSYSCRHTVRLSQLQLPTHCPSIALHLPK